MNPRPLRVGMLGVSHVAHAISYGRCLAATEAVELVGIFDTDPAIARGAASSLGDIPVFGRMDELLEAGRLDAVVVAGATDEHRYAVEAAAAAGSHVLCEKPLATTLDDAQKMLETCERANVQLQVAFVCRFYPMVQVARAMVAQREIGPILGMVGGNRGRPPLPPAYPGWITDPLRAGGGALFDHTAHVVDAMRHITGSEVTSVRAETSTLFQPQLKVDDAALLLLEFDNGAVASIDPSWSIPEGNPIHYDFYLRFLGGKGTLDLDDRRQALEVSRDHQVGRSTVLEQFGKSLDGRMIEHFLHCVREGVTAPPAATGEDGLRALEVTLAAYEAAATGTTISFVDPPETVHPLAQMR